MNQQPSFSCGLPVICLSIFVGPFIKCSDGPILGRIDSGSVVKSASLLISQVAASVHQWVYSARWSRLCGDSRLFYMTKTIVWLGKQQTWPAGDLPGMFIHSMQRPHGIWEIFMGLAANHFPHRQETPRFVGEPPSAADESTPEVQHLVLNQFTYQTP